jgi:hypothetical protein
MQSSGLVSVRPSNVGRALRIKVDNCAPRPEKPMR